RRQASGGVQRLLSLDSLERIEVDDIAWPALHLALFLHRDFETFRLRHAPDLDDVEHNAKEPGAAIGPHFERTEMFPRAEVSLLHHVFSIEQGPRNAVCRSQQRIQMRQGFTFKALKTRLSFLLVHHDWIILVRDQDWRARREMRKPPL